MPAGLICWSLVVASTGLCVEVLVAVVPRPTTVSGLADRLIPPLPFNTLEAVPGCTSLEFAGVNRLVFLLAPTDWGVPVVVCTPSPVVVRKAITSIVN